MIPKTIRVFPLSKIKEPKDFGTLDKVYEYFCDLLPFKVPPGRFDIPSDSHFEKNSLVLFQYTEKKGEGKIIAHAMLISDGCVFDGELDGYIGYYLLDNIVIYKSPVTEEEIDHIWRGRRLCQAKHKLDVSKYSEYMSLLKIKGN